MKPRSIHVIFVIAALMLACNMPGVSAPAAPAAGAAGNPTATNTVAAPAAAADTATSSPTDTPTVAVTDTPSKPSLTPIKDPVNCRFGPAGTYESVGAGLAVGASADVLGKNADASWWQIAASSGNGDKCWVAASVVTTTGDVSQVPLVAAPMTFVTGLTISLKPTSINLGPGCIKPATPIAITGSISVNGPTLVKWYFETQQGGPMSTHSTNFTMYGTQLFTASYTPGSLKKGTYWVHLVVTSPNSMMMEATYQIKCS